MPNSLQGNPAEADPSLYKGIPSKTQRLVSSRPDELFSASLVSSSTSSTTLTQLPDSLRGSGSVHPSASLSGKPQSPSTQSLSLGVTVPDETEAAPTTPALTVAVETLAPEIEETDPQSDAPTSSTEPHRPLQTPSPTVSSFAQDSEGAQAVEIADHRTPSRAPSTARETLRSSFTRLKNLSKASIRTPSVVSRRALSRISKLSRKSSKPPATNDVAIQDTDTYSVEPDPFRSSSATSQDLEAPAPSSEVAPITESAALTEEPEPLAPEQAPEPPRESPASSRAPSTVTTVRRSSLRTSVSKLGASLRQSSRVSFKALSRISSSGRSQSIPSPPALESVTPVPGTPKSPTTGPVFPASPEFPPPRPRSLTSSEKLQRPPSLVPVPSPPDTVPVVISPHELTASPTVYPSEFDSPAATTLPPPSRRSSWWFSPSQVFSTSTLPADTATQLSPPAAPRSPPKELTPEGSSEPAQEHPFRPPVTKSSSRSLLRASFSQPTVSPAPVQQPLPAASTTNLGSSAAPTTYQTQSATSTSYQPATSTSYQSPSAASTTLRHLSAPPSSYRQLSTPSSTLRQSSAPPSTRRQFSAPSAATSYHTQKSAPPTTLTSQPSSIPRSRAPSGTARSSESILFPRSGSFGDSQQTSQIPSRVPSQNPILIPSASSVPTPTVRSTNSSRTSPTKTYSRAASRLSSRRTSRRTVTRLPSIVSSRASQSNPNLTPGSIGNPENPEKVAVSVTDSLPAPPIAVTLPVSPKKSGSFLSSFSSTGSTSRKSRSRSITRITSSRPSLLSLARTPISALVSRRESRTSASKSSHSKETSQASLRSDVPSPSAPPPSDTRAPSRKPSLISRLLPSKEASQASLRTSTAAPQPPSPSAPSSPDSFTPSHAPSVVSRLAPSPKSSHIFQPSRKPSRHFAPHELTTLPEQLVASDGEHIVIPPEILARMPINEDESTIDVGMGADYEGYTWFENRPPKPEPKAPETVSPPYVPMPDILEKNEAFIYALQAAPNVLYANYKQYGQLGVLGWCAEFSELIDHLKTLGFDGNMFVNTRTQALATCQELLKLRLDIKMQIIIMYLSSQVARLRRFLDGEGKYDDYPTAEFPLDITRNYG